MMHLFMMIYMLFAGAAFGQTALTHTHTFDSGDYNTGHVEAGDFYNGPTGGTVTVVLNDPDYTDSTVEKGRVAVLASQTLIEQTLTVPIETPSNGSSCGTPVNCEDFLGFPLNRNIDGASLNELIISSSSSAGEIYHSNNGGTDFIGSWPQATGGPVDWASYWNMGPGAGNVRSDVTSTEVVISEWAGVTYVFEKADGDIVNAHNVYTDSFWSNAGYNDEYISGPVAIQDLDGDGEEEMIAFGADSGHVFVMTADQGTGTQGLTIEWSSVGIGNSGYAEGTGPAIGDIDSTGEEEIVVVPSYSDGAYWVKAFTYVSGWNVCKYKWQVGGTGYYNTSPVIGQVYNTSGSNPEIVVFSNDAILSVLTVPSSHSGSGNCDDVTTGNVWEYAMSETDAWFSPVLLDLSSSNGADLDILIASYTRAEVIDAEDHSSPVKLYFDSPDTQGAGGAPATQFFPTAAALNSPVSNEGAVIYLPGYTDGKVYRLVTCYRSNASLCPGGVNQTNPTMTWRTFMGRDGRIGQAL